jgi:hypothetical protein
VVLYWEGWWGFESECMGDGDLDFLHAILSGEAYSRKRCARSSNCIAVLVHDSNFTKFCFNFVGRVVRCSGVFESEILRHVFHNLLPFILSSGLYPSKRIETLDIIQILVSKVCACISSVVRTCFSYPSGEFSIRCTIACPCNRDLLTRQYLLSMP